MASILNIPPEWGLGMMHSIVFAGGIQGPWQVSSMTAVTGASLPEVEAIAVHDGDWEGDLDSRWELRGLPSNIRYSTRNELSSLRAVQASLGRSECRCAALIPIKKSADWWQLAQDERRAIFEEDSRHTAIGLSYLPGVARKLLHSRDLGEPFDFLTWFEFSNDDASRFQELLDRLRASREWQYVEREVDIRLVR